MNSKTAEAFARVIDKAHDQVEQARSQAIDDCIKVVKAAERENHSWVDANFVVSRLESLKLMPSPQETEGNK